VQRTNKKQALAWQGYPIYLLSIGISDDPFLEQFSKGQRHKILGAFVSALREGRFSTKKSTMIRSDSIQAALDCISQTFKLADKPDPRLNNNGNIAFFLQRQLQGYKSLDPGETPQVAVTGSILQQFFKQSISPVDIALCELFIGAFFLAMRSCESLQVSGQRKTKILALHNIIFFLGNRVISHGSPPPSLHKANSVAIIFNFQKKDTKNDIITHHKTDNKLLCPEKIWAKIVRQIHNYKSSNPDTTVNTYFFDDGSRLLFIGPHLLKRLRLATTAIGADTLGFTAKQIGLHSARSRAAIAMYLAGIPVFTIMLLGRWSSDAFSDTFGNR